MNNSAGKSTAVIVALGLVLVSSLLSRAEAAQNLRYATWDPPHHEWIKFGVDRWIKSVGEVTEGRVKVRKLAKGLGAPPAYHDFIKKGAIDVAHIIPAYTPGRFQLHKIAEFPFLSHSAKARTVAYWRVYAKHFANAGGRIVPTGTGSALHGGSAQSFPYAIAKRGTECMIQGLAREGAPENILVNGVRLGFISSEFHERWHEKTEDDLKARADLVPLKRAGDPDEAAALMIYLLSGWSSFITGQMFPLAGGDWL
jgi:hypothetical protein